MSSRRDLHYYAQGRPTFPAVLVTDTTKSKYLFRTKKGLERLHESKVHMGSGSADPFGSMVYIGESPSKGCWVDSIDVCIDNNCTEPRLGASIGSNTSVAA